MADIFPKWILEGDTIIIRKATFHKDMATDLKAVKGGGLFHFDSHTRTFILYGSSHDFGKANPNDMQSAIENKRVGRRIDDDRYRDYNIVFTEEDNYAKAIVDFLITKQS